MQQLSANELQQVSGGTLCLLGLGASVVSTGAQALTGLITACPLAGTIAQGVTGATQAAGTVGSAILNGIVNIPTIALNEFGKLAGSVSCGCTTNPPNPTDPKPPTSPI